MPMKIPPEVLAKRKPLTAEDVIRAEKAAARLMDPSVSAESEAEFAGMFSRGMKYRAMGAGAAAGAPEDAPPAEAGFHEAMAAAMGAGDRTAEAAALREALHGVMAHEEELHAALHGTRPTAASVAAGRKAHAGDSSDDEVVEVGAAGVRAAEVVLDEDGLETVAMDAGVTASLLDAQHSTLQAQVRFDNFVDDDLSPDDISDASDAEWVDVAPPTSTPNPPPGRTAAQRRVCNVKWLPPSDSDPLPSAAAAAVPAADSSDDEIIEVGQAAAKPAADSSDDEIIEVGQAAAKPAVKPAPPKVLPWEVEEAPAAPAGKPAFGPAPPPAKPSYAADYPEVENARPQEKKLRRWMAQVQSVALPPGWTVNAATLKAMPPHEDAGVAGAREREAMDAAFAPENVQRLHAKLVEENTKDYDKEISEIRPITDADLFIEDECRKYTNDGLTDKQDLPEYLANHLAGMDAQLFGALNVPTEQTASSKVHEAAYIASKAAASGPPLPKTMDIPDDVEPPVPGGAMSSRPADDAEERWEEACQPFELDPDFDYDNIENPTPKPRTPWEV